MILKKITIPADGGNKVKTMPVYTEKEKTWEYERCHSDYNSVSLSAVMDAYSEYKQNSKWD